MIAFGYVAVNECFTFVKYPNEVWRKISATYAVSIMFHDKFHSESEIIHPMEFCLNEMVEIL